MKREHDPILERLHQQLPMPGDAFERLERHRKAKAMRSGIVAGAVALGVTGALVTGLILARSPSSGSDSNGSASGGTSPDGWTMPEGLAIPAGSFAYVHVVEYPGDGQPGSATVQRTWFSPSDGSGRLAVSGVASDPTINSGPQTQGPYSHDDSFPPGEMGQGERWLGLDDLSTDPVVLATQLAEPYASPGPTSTASPAPAQVEVSVAETADYILSMANTATPELKASLSQVLAGLEAATVNEATSDPVGRPAWSVRLAGPGGARTKTWWFDPQSDQLLASVRIYPDGTTYYMVYEAAGVVSATSDTTPQPAFISPTTDVPPGAKA
jgi:hypothetical protein